MPRKYNYTKKTGRPTKYNEDVLQATKEYLEQHLANKQSVPYIEEISLQLHIDDDQLNNYTKLYPDFHATIKEIKKLQRVRLFKHTLQNNPAGAIFQLKANHGLMEAEKRILVGEKDAEPIKIQFVSDKRE